MKLSLKGKKRERGETEREGLGMSARKAGRRLGDGRAEESGDIGGRKSALVQDVVHCMTQTQS